MKRRKFLTIAGISATALALPVVAINSNAFFKQAVVSVITRQLNYLNLDKKGVEQYAEDLTREMQNFSFERAKKIRVKVGSEYLFPGSLSKMDVEDGFLSNFLLSTDFFTNKMDETMLVKYNGLFHGYKKPCSNPFSHFYYPPTSTT